MNVTPKGFAALTHILMDLARTYSSDRLAMTLEGGYNLTGLRESVRAVLKELMQASILIESDLTALEEVPAPPIVNKVIEVQRLYWPSLSFS
jgi:acetoin utilization deacetylase AcuC-like enzyme